MTKFSGSCLCGAVKYEGEGEPMFMGNCHCLDCRKSSASGHMSLMAVPGAGVNMTGKVTGYDMKADSGATVTHHFCPTCGSQMYNKTTSMDGVIVLIASTLDDPEVFAPQMSVYAKRATSWDKPVDGAPHFPEMPPMGD